MQHGDSIKSVGWGDAETQFLRFKKLTEGLIVEGSSILDFGCGLGHLVEFLEKQNLRQYEYVGVDLCVSFIEHAKEKYREKNNINFYKGDIFHKDLEAHSFDIALASGVFSLNQENIKNYTFDAMKKMFDLVNHSVSVNFLSTYCDFQLKKNVHYDPSEILNEAFKITSDVKLLHDYELYEFTLILNK